MKWKKRYWSKSLINIGDSPCQLDANNFLTSSNSGQTIIGNPGELGIGGVRRGALEASNVDFSREFTSLIIAQRAFQANTRVITTADNMLQDLIRIVG